MCSGISCHSSSLIAGRFLSASISGEVQVGQVYLSCLHPGVVVAGVRLGISRYSMCSAAVFAKLVSMYLGALWLGG